MRPTLRAICRAASLLAGIAPCLQAQVADSSPFRRLDLPTPTSVRAASGAPGHDYWQQKVDYDLEGTLDTAKNEIRGRETIRYSNDSPDSLTYIWLQLDQNIFGANSINRSAPPPPLMFAGVPFDMAVTGAPAGFVIDTLKVEGIAATPHIWDTMLRLDLDRAIASGETVVLTITWRFTVPENGAARMGRDGKDYEIAQWYPRLAVYDDVHGWNTLPYIGPGEFYLEYGDIHARITVPSGMVVAGTGTLLNPDAVLSADERGRLQRASQSDEPVAVITAAEASAGRGHSTGMTTWSYAAHNVRDFAWATAPNFQWDAVRWSASPTDNKLIQTFYRPGAANWDKAIRMARHAIMSHSRWLTYAYPQASAVEGPINGMEYPMIVFVPADTSMHSLSWVMMHELGHEWFPMMLGSDERRYPWMDEGFNSFIDLYTVSDWWQGDAHADSVLNGPLTSYAANAVPGKEQPLITVPSEVHNLYWTAYQKPALMLRLLREDVLGTETFDAAFREYARRWQFRHPQPADFFRTMENVSGRDLGWYWREWVYTTARLDQSVESVTPSRDSTRIVLANRREMLMPAEVKLTFSDGTSETRRIPIEMWNYGRRFTLTIATAGKRVTAVEIDPRHAYPDTDRSNNRWPRSARGAH
ncbi:MAG TPA: M1 family aminopeptidase [Gemmatimonadales bacterium]|jgi:hypothetical protein